MSSNLRVFNGSDSKEFAFSVGDQGSIPGLGRSPEEGNGYPLQYSCLENPMDRGAWWAAVHGVIKSWTRLSIEHTHSVRGLITVDVGRERSEPLLGTS